VRQALKCAINYESIQKHIVPDTCVVRQGFEPSMILGAVKENPFKYDPDNAKALLAQAGYAQGFAATLDHYSEEPFVDIAPAIQAKLAAVGIKASLVSVCASRPSPRCGPASTSWSSISGSVTISNRNSNAQAFNANPDDSDDSPMKIIAWRCHFTTRS